MIQNRKWKLMQLLFVDFLQYKIRLDFIIYVYSNTTHQINKNHRFKKSFSFQTHRGFFLTAISVIWRKWPPQHRFWWDSVIGRHNHLINPLVNECTCQSCFNIDVLISELMLYSLAGRNGQPFSLNPQLTQCCQIPSSVPVCRANSDEGQKETKREH